MNFDIKKRKPDMLGKGISQLIAEGYHMGVVEDHISLLHEYNDIKDVSQMLLGKLGESQGLGRWLLPSLGILDSTPCPLTCHCPTPVSYPAPFPTLTSLCSPGQPAKQACSSCFVLSPGSQAQVLLGSDFEQDLPTFEIAVMVPVLPWPAETLRYHGYL